MPTKKSDPTAAATNDTATKTVTMPYGVPGYTLHDVQREIPATEPPVLPINADLQYIGKSPTRWDAHAKVSGSGRYTADIQLPGMLYAAMVTANVPHASIVSIDTSEASKMPGVKGVYVIQHVLGEAVLRDPSLDPSRYPIVRYAGQPIAAVAATYPHIAEEAAQLVKVQYAAKPFVVDMEMARQADAPQVFPGPADEAGSAGGGGGPHDVPQKGNVHGPSVNKRGDAEQGFKDADFIVESKYTTQVQVHNALETHGVVADWKPNLLTVWASTQGTASVRDELADYFKIPKSQIRVITEYVGGGFGAKFGAGNEGTVAAILSKQTGAPVRLMLRSQRGAAFCRQSPQLRPDAEDWRQKGRNPDAIQLISYGTAGCGTGAGCAGPATNLYQSASLHTEENDVFINAGPAAAFRAPGHPQGAFALEQTIDEMAEKLNMEPLEFREKLTPIQCAAWSARLFARARSGSRAIPPPTRIPDPSSAVSGFRSPSGIDSLTWILRRKCEFIATARWKFSPPCRTSAPASRR